MKLIDNFGINDVDYKVTWFDEDHKRHECPYFSRWRGILKRQKFSTGKAFSRIPAYNDVTVSEQWRRLSDFKAWMEVQKWEGLHLDKDILVAGNREYGPERCVFVPIYMNTILCTNKKSRGALPLGVHYKIPTHGGYNNYKASCSVYVGDGLSKKFQKYVGCSDNPKDAHHIWQKFKIIEIEKTLSRYRKEDFYIEEVEIAMQKRIEALKSDLDAGRETFDFWQLDGGASFYRLTATDPVNGNVETKDIVSATLTSEQLV